MKRKILIVEDNIMLAGQQQKWLEKRECEVVTTIDEPGARKRLAGERYDLVLADVRLPEGNGISLLGWMNRERIDVPFIVMTGYASVTDAVKAIKLGAKDYLAKPVQMEELLELIKEVANPRSVVYENDKNFFRRTSPQMLEVEELLRTVAPFDVSVLVLGSNGTGKESVARSIHQNSDRHDRPFVAVNCGVVPKELAPSLFFGHVKGTFTGADSNREGYFGTAKGGTLFLDEIGTLSIEVQAMLLRVLQEGVYMPIGDNREKRADVRIVAATNEDLQQAIKEKRFREDLYHRLCEFEITLPSLSECPEDILPLAEHFRKKFSGELKRNTEGFDAEAEQILLSYSWPGNVRELQNKVKRAVLLAKTPVIGKKELHINIEDANSVFDGEMPGKGQDERLSIIKALKASGGHRQKAARLLGINPATLYRKMNKYGIK